MHSWIRCYCTGELRKGAKVVSGGDDSASIPGYKGCKCLGFPKQKGSSWESGDRVCPFYDVNIWHHIFRHLQFKCCRDHFFFPESCHLPDELQKLRWIAVHNTQAADNLMLTVGFQPLH